MAVENTRTTELDLCECAAETSQMNAQYLRCFSARSQGTIRGEGPQKKKMVFSEVGTWHAGLVQFVVQRGTLFPGQAFHDHFLHAEQMDLQCLGQGGLAPRKALDDAAQIKRLDLHSLQDSREGQGSLQTDKRASGFTIRIEREDGVQIFTVS